MTRDLSLEHKSSIQKPSVKSNNAKVGSIVWVDVNKVKPNDYNPNVMNKERFNALCNFLETHNAEELDPIWLRHDGIGNYEIIDGEHRWKAAKKVGWKRLRAFVIDLEEDKAKSFNVRKNRERGSLDAIKFGKILFEEKGTCLEIAKRYGTTEQMVKDYRWIYQNQEAILEFVKNDSRFSATVITKSRARRILRELKREERGETEKVLQDAEQQSIESKQLENFLSRYAKALKKNPLPAVQKDEIQTAIEFFKRLLENKHITCPICGEKHLQWRCGHEF